MVRSVENLAMLEAALGNKIIVDASEIPKANNSDVSKPVVTKRMGFQPTNLNGFFRRISVINRMINWSYSAATCARFLTQAFARYKIPPCGGKNLQHKEMWKKNGLNFIWNLFLKKSSTFFKKYCRWFRNPAKNHSTLIVEIPMSYRVFYTSERCFGLGISGSQQQVSLVTRGRDLPTLNLPRPTWILSLHHLALSA